MAGIILPHPPALPITQPKQIPQRGTPSLPPPVSVLVPSGPRSGHLGLDSFSPVNQNGSFEFDRVLKSGEVYKRTKKTKQWKSFHLVLRPNLLSIYKKSCEDRLHSQIVLSDLTAVACLKDPKGRRQHVFGLFSPSRNFHLQAKDDIEARAWVELIRRQARIDEDEQDMILGSHIANEGHHFLPGDERERWEQERLGSSSPEPIEKASRPSTTRDGIRIPGIQNSSLNNLEYSGDDLGPHSDFSDTAPSQSYTEPSFGSFIQRKISKGNAPRNPALPLQLGAPRNVSQGDGFRPDQEKDRVIWHGYLLYLKSKGGVRQWKKLWAVLRPINLAFYKNEDEYAARLILPLSNMIDAVEIDPVSRSKLYCMQIIAEEKSYRFSAPDEEALARWLGALKSQLARRKDGAAKHVAAP